MKILNLRDNVVARFIDLGDNYGKDDLLVNDEYPIIEFCWHSETSKSGYSLIGSYTVDTINSIENSGLYVHEDVQLSEEEADILKSEGYPVVEETSDLGLS